MDKPVISAVNGFCIAGGMEFIQGTDLRVASENASFGLQEVKWAIIPAAGSLARLQRQIPYCKAMEILLTGNRIDAQEAWRLGLVNYVVPQEKLIAKAEELAATIAQNGPLAVRKIKEAVRRTSGRPYEEAFKIENEIAREVMKSEDAKEGPRSFMEKRKPNYKGRVERSGSRERAHRVGIVARRGCGGADRKDHGMRDAGGAEARDEIAAALGIAEHCDFAARCFRDGFGRLVALAFLPQPAHLVELSRESVAREHLVVAVDECVAGQLAPERIDGLVFVFRDAHSDVDADVDGGGSRPAALAPSLMCCTIGGIASGGE